MHLTIALSAAILLLVSTASAATIDDVIASNSALTSQADTVDIPVVAVTPETPATTVQVYPFLDCRDYTAQTAPNQTC